MKAMVGNRVVGGKLNKTKQENMPSFINSQLTSVDNSHNHTAIRIQHLRAVSKPMSMVSPYPWYFSWRLHGVLD